MSVLLRVAAVLTAVWAAVLLGFKDHVYGSAALLPLTRSFANGLGIAYVSLAVSFWCAAADPVRHRGIVYAAIVFMTLRMSNDVYELLALMPPEHALISLGDLVWSTGLLVGLLEALPRTFRGTPPR